MPTLAELQKMTARFAPADIGADLSALPKNEREALARLVDAARIMDALFLRQVWAGNDAMLQDLAQRAANAGRAARLAHGRRPAALLPDQQGTVGSARSQQARSSPARRPSPKRRTSIPPAPRRPRSRSGSTACRVPRRRPRPASSPPSVAATRDSSPCLTAWSTRASSRAPPICCARRRSSPAMRR